MAGRLWMALVGIGLALAIAPSAAAQPGKLHRVVAVGDLHGDFEAWRAIVRAAGLVDKRGHWTGGTTVLVQTGDVVDRGPDGLKIIEDLMRLQREATRAHGQVVALVGNHEAMNLTGDLRYVSPADYAAYATGQSERLREQIYQANKAKIEAAYGARDPKATPETIKAMWRQATPLGFIEHQQAWAPDGKIGRWIVGNPAVAQIDGSLFVHGGISPAFAHTPLAEINRQAAAALAAANTAPEAVINDPAGPLWHRGLAARDGPPDEAPPAAPAAAAPPPPSVSEQLDVLLTAFGSKRIVIAHTPTLSGIAVLNGGRLIRIDTGISAVFGGTLSYLDIIDGNPVAHAVARPTPGRKGTD